ncbi:HlyD family secretion protein [Pedobacter sp. NJ-S-72]
MEENVYFANARSEEVQTIIERMPTRFGFWITIIVVFIFVLMAFFGWIVRYPDIVSGQITINANSAPIKLVANGSGKIKLNGIKSMEEVDEGQIIAYLENSTDLKNLIFIDSLLQSYNPSSDEIINIHQKLPHNLSLGELNLKYYSFSNALQGFINYKQDKLMDKQSRNFEELLNEQRKAINSVEKRLGMSENSLKYSNKFYSRDSVLFKKRVISESELDKTEMNYLSAKDAYQNAVNNLISAKQAAQQTKSKIEELNIQKPEKEKELRIALISAYNDLVDNIKSWEQKYVFKAPFKGCVQFLKFYSENQFVQNGEQVFTIIPKHEKALGQLILPAQGSGKIKVGQEVIVKLDNYPYMEYGSVTGRVNSISLTQVLLKQKQAKSTPI